MKFPYALLIAAATFRAPAIAAEAFLPLPSAEPPTLSDSHIQERLQLLDPTISIQYDPLIKDYLKQYIYEAPRTSEALLGRTALYFPIFEHYLRLNRLPETLKYLPIVESMLHPKAISPMKAVGLWQFTSHTGHQYGLTINGHVDERQDPIRATEAAVCYLSDLYTQFQDWTLVLAAYNCGPTRMQQAIRASGSRDYWTLRRYLPLESQKYVPRFIAANYLMRYFHEHRLEPAYPNPELQRTQTIKVYDYFSFNDISKLTGLSTRVISQLNPSYHRAYIPKSTKGFYLVLPEDMMAAFKRGKDEARALPASVHTFSEQVTRKHSVKNGETLSQLARAYGCTVNDIKRWNGLVGDALYFGQELTLYVQPKQTVSSEIEPERRWYDLRQG